MTLLLNVLQKRLEGWGFFNFGVNINTQFFIRNGLWHLRIINCPCRVKSGISSNFFSR